MIYKIEDLTRDYYEKIKSHRELEHQIGRLQNFRNIISTCSELSGDLVEFGTWRGFSLQWIAYFMERNGMFDRRLLGLDGFVGLPYADGLDFPVGLFADTSLEMCRETIYSNPNLYPETKERIKIEKFLFKQKKEILDYLAANSFKKFCFLHIDCDVTQSAAEIFDLIETGGLLADHSYVLFDDYGCQSGLAQFVESTMEKMKSSWEVTVHSSTNLTKNFRLVRRQTQTQKVQNVW